MRPLPGQKQMQVSDGWNFLIFPTLKKKLVGTDHAPGWSIKKAGGGHKDTAQRGLFKGIPEVTRALESLSVFAVDKKKLQDNFYITIYLLHFFLVNCTLSLNVPVHVQVPLVLRVLIQLAYGMNGNLNCGIGAELRVTVKDTESFPCKTSRIRHLSESVLSKKTWDS